MVGTVTVVGASGTQIPVTVNGSVAFSLAQAYANQISSLGNTLFSPTLVAGGSPVSVPSGRVGEAIITVSGTYTFPTGYSSVTDSATGGVFLNASAITTFTEVLASTGGTTLLGGTGGGLFVAGGGDNLFEGPSSGGGTYVISTSPGNDSIYGNSGDDLIYTDAGNNQIFTGTGNDTVWSLGTDSIIAGSGSNTIGLLGSGSTVYGGTGTLLLADSGTGNTFVGSSGSTFIYDGTSTTDYLAGNSTVVGGTNDTIYASANTTVYGGSGTVVNMTGTGSLEFIANPGIAATIDGGNPTAVAATVYGASNANIVYSSSSGLSYLIAGTGNETLNGSGASGSLLLFGNGSDTDLIGGAGPDTLIAGTGSSTLTGGSGANLFVFSNGLASKDVITDFGSSAGNLVGLFGYGAGAVTTALGTATNNSTGGSSISLSDNTTITFTNMTAEQLKAHSSQFFSS